MVQGEFYRKFPLYHQRLREYNNVMNFIKGLTNDTLTLKVFFNKGILNPIKHRTVSFLKKHLRFLTGC